MPANAVELKIPTLCYLEDVSRNSSCGVCVVEVKNARSLVRSCTACVHEGTEIVTNSARIRDARKTNVELILANHPKDCLSCLRNQNCELQTIASDLGVKEDRFVRTKKDNSVTRPRFPSSETRTSASCVAGV